MDSGTKRKRSDAQGISNKTIAVNSDIRTNAGELLGFILDSAVESLAFHGKC